MSVNGLGCGGIRVLGYECGGVGVLGCHPVFDLFELGEKF